jgi:hypothetical protein
MYNSVKCLKCNRMVRNTFKARFVHLQRYHLDIFMLNLVQILVNEEKLILLGKHFGNVVRHKAYGAIKQNH